MRLENSKAGRKGNLNVATEVCRLYLNIFNVILCSYIMRIMCSNQVFQVAPSLHMVEIRKAKGDTLEFHKVHYSAENVRYNICKKDFPYTILLF